MGWSFDPIDSIDLFICTFTYWGRLLDLKMSLCGSFLLSLRSLQRVFGGHMFGTDDKTKKNVIML